MNLFKDMEIGTCKTVNAKKRKTREGYRSLAETYNKAHGESDNKYISVSLSEGPDVVVLRCLSYEKYLAWKAGKMKRSEFIGQIKKKSFCRPERTDKEIGPMREGNCHCKGTFRHCLSERVNYQSLSQTGHYPIFVSIQWKAAEVYSCQRDPGETDGFLRT